jgi:hypothetical protein
VHASGGGSRRIGTVAFMLLDGHLPGWAFSQDQDGTYRETFPRSRYLIAEADDAESCMASAAISATAGLTWYPASEAGYRVAGTAG